MSVWAQVPGAFFDDMVLDDRTGDEYVSRPLIHAGKSTVIYDANTGAPLFSTNTTGFGPALLKITIN